jgi:beta-glucosidase
MLRWKSFGILVTSLFASSFALLAQQPQNAAQKPWMDTTLSPDARAELVLQQLTLDEKIGFLHGTGHPDFGTPSPQLKDSNGGAGYVVGIPRLGIPGIQMEDAAYGVTKSAPAGRYSTAMPSDIALSASWSVSAAAQYGEVIGRELRAQGYNMTLGGGVNLARELRNGRNFEYGGEDPILAGTMVGEAIRSLQAQHVIGDLKHYAVNDQESGRNAVNVNIDERSLRETDLFAFQIALKHSNAGAFMCSYNRLNGDFACENRHLLTDVLRRDWGFQGFVVSDWAGTHSTIKALAAGLDNEEPNGTFFGEALKQAVIAGKVSLPELNSHVLRILRTEFATGIVDYPVVRSVPDVEAGLRATQQIEEQSIVLLKNDHDQLPLQPGALRRVAIIGAHADVGMISGGGSAQVDPPVGNAIKPPGEGATKWLTENWFPTSPFKALRDRLPAAEVIYDPGTDAVKAAELARSADVALVFAYQWESEDADLPSLELSGQQNALVTKVAAANPHTVVVLETGSAVTMPWVQQVSSIVEVWYGGSKGADALANVLLGAVNPSGKLPITFPVNEADLPHAVVVQPPPQSTGAYYGADREQQNERGFPAFQVNYDEGLKVGYKWYDAQGLKVQFPFGYGLSYTTFQYSALQVEAGEKGVAVRFRVSNTGKRAGAEVAEIYASLPASTQEPPKRLVGWSKVLLQPGESRELSVDVDRQLLSVYDVQQGRWQLASGSYDFMVGGSSRDLPLKTNVKLQ